MQSALERPRLDRPSILLVDDEPEVLESLKILFEFAFRDARIYTATDAITALRLLRREPIDVVLLDYALPEMDGLDLWRRARHVAPELEGLLVTGHLDGDLASRATDAGIDLHFAKPIVVPQMIGAVERLLGRHGNGSLVQA